MEINFSDDASRLNESFMPEEGIFSGDKDLESVIIKEFTDSTGFTSSPSEGNIKADIPVKSLLANGFRLLHDDLSSLKVIGIVAGAGSVASNLLSGTAGGVANGLVGALGEALGNFAGGIAEGIGNSLQDLDIVKNDPDIQAIKKEGLLAYNKAFYDPTLQTVSGVLSGITNAVGEALGGFVGGVVEGLGSSIQDLSTVLTDPEIQAIKKKGLLAYTQAHYDPSLQEASGVLSGITEAVGKAMGGFVGGVTSGLGNSIQDLAFMLEDDSNGGDVLDATARSKSVRLTKKYGLIKYAEAFYDPDLQGASGTLSGIANAASKAIGALAGGLAEGIVSSVADAAISAEDDSNGGDVLNADDRARSIRLTKKYGLIKYAEAFYDPTIQEASGTMAAIVNGIAQLGPEFFGGLLEGSLNALTDVKTLATDPDIAATKKKGMQVYIETLYGEDAMKEKAELALASSKWGDVASGVVEGLGDLISTTVDTGLDVLKDAGAGVLGLFGIKLGGSEQETATASVSATNTISVQPHPQYTAPLNAISLKSIDIAEDTELIQQKLGSLTANLTLKLDELSDKLSSIIKVMEGTSSNTSGPISFFKGVDIEA